MTILTKEQLGELTQRVNDRLDEFPTVFDHIHPGVVRLVHDVIREWEESSTDIGSSHYDEGYQAGLIAAETKAHDEAFTRGFNYGVEQTKAKQTTIVPPTNGNGHSHEAKEPVVTLSPATVATLGPEHTTVTPLKAVGRSGNALPTREELVAEVKRQAMGGVMPTMATFDKSRPANWATAAAHLLRLKLGWDDLRVLAELKPNRREE